MIIACDVDNVLLNLQETVIRLFNKRYNTHYTLNDIIKYNVNDVLPVSDAYNMIKMYGEDGIYNWVEPVDGAKDGLEELIKQGHDVYLVTDAIPNNYYNKFKCLQLHFPYIHRDKIVVLSHKELFKADIVIEDNPKHLVSCKNCHSICLDYPWNREIDDENHIIHRCANWNEIIDIVNKIDEGEIEYNDKNFKEKRRASKL